MDDQGHIRQLDRGEALKRGEIELDQATAEGLAALSPRARREYHKAICEGRSADFANAAALSVDGVLILEPQR